MGAGDIIWSNMVFLITVTVLQQGIDKTIIQPSYPEPNCAELSTCGIMCMFSGYNSK